MAKGEKSFSTKGKQAKKSVRRLCPVGMYDLKIRTDRAEVKQAKSGRSRVTMAFEALKTAGDDGKNAFVYHDLHLGLEPGADGVPMVERANQLVGLARAVGTDLNNVDQVSITATPDPRNKPDEQVKEQALNAMQVLKWVKTLDGRIVKGQVKHETRTGEGAATDDEGRPLKDARIAYFEAAESDEDEDETDEAEDEETDEDEDEEGDEDEADEEADDEDADEDEDEEEKPAPKKKAKKK